MAVPKSVGLLLSAAPAPGVVAGSPGRLSDVRGLRPEFRDQRLHLRRCDQHPRDAIGHGDAAGIGKVHRISAMLRIRRDRVGVADEPLEIGKRNPVAGSIS